MCSNGTRGGPKYDLNDVKRLVSDWLADPKSQSFHLSLPKRSTDCVALTLGVTIEAAVTLIGHGMLQLSEQDFNRRVLMWGGPEVADEYGLQGYAGHNWYVKFMIEDGELNQLSFHPLEKEMVLPNKLTLKVTYPK